MRGRVGYRLSSGHRDQADGEDDAAVRGGLAAARVLLYGACMVLVAAGMQAAATLVSALALAVVLATVLAPILRRLREAGLPGWLAGLVVLAPVVILGGLFVGFLIQSLVELLISVLRSKSGQRLAHRSGGAWPGISSATFSKSCRDQ